MAKTLSSVRNLNVAVREWEDQVVFLHKIVDGAADKSYGIHVAQLAGVPRSVNDRAREVLHWLESQHHQADATDGSLATKSQKSQSPSSNGAIARRPSQWQLTLFGYEQARAEQRRRGQGGHRLGIGLACYL